MVLATANKLKRLLCLSYIGKVDPTELERCREDIKALLAELEPEFNILVDLTHLESMGLDCVAAIGRNMEMVDQAGVRTIVRVIPDPYKDIGMNILSIFHLPHRPRIVTCENMVEAARALSL
jgi:anti-anti-sigma regulatory factor